MTTKDYFKNIITDGIYLTERDYDMDALTTEEKVKIVHNIFKEEYGHEIIRYKNNEKEVFSSWLRGLPSVLDFPYMYVDMLESAKKDGVVFNTVQEEDRFLETYFDNLTIAFFNLLEKTNKKIKTMNRLVCIFRHNKYNMEEVFVANSPKDLEDFILENVERFKESTLSVQWAEQIKNNIMKETLRKKLENEISIIDARCKQLLENIEDYKKNNSFEEAMKNDIKHRQLSMVSQSLKKLLR